MKRVSKLLLIVSFISASALAQNIPSELQGKWKITRILPATTITCWGDREARKILNTQIEYTSTSFRWKSFNTRLPRVERKEITATEFQQENSGSGTDASYVDFKQLGFRSRKVVQISIDHPDADITGATVEIPGDTVLIKDPNVIVLSVCNDYFEAKRVASPKKQIESRTEYLRR